MAGTASPSIIDNAPASQDVAFWTDEKLEADIAGLQNAIREWAIAREVWFDSGFRPWLEHVDGEPSEFDPVVSVHYFGSDFADLVLDGGLWQEFSDMVEALGFHYDRETYGTVFYYPVEGARSEAYVRYFRWRWVCSLVQEDFADVYEELYGHFAACPEDLHRLGWRDFEILVARTLQTQGFQVELGPGRGDGGVDIRLLQRDPLGDIMTLVQVKKYAEKNSIGLEAVAALHGVATVEKSDRSLFVTTSSYQPAARNFAGRTSGKLDLRTSADVADWCRTAQDGIIRDKSTLATPAAVERLLLDLRRHRDRRILHTSWGYNSTHNSFAVILKETKHAALVMALPRQTFSDDGYGQRGTEVPLLDATAAGNLRGETVWRAKRKVSSDGEVSFWDGNHLLHSWNGAPVGFDYYD